MLRRHRRSNASVLCIFEDTNFLVGISGERNGVHRMEVINGELYAADEKRLAIENAHRNPLDMEDDE